MNILITGGKGYIGQYLMEYFSNENVYITTRNPKNSKERKMVLTEDKSIEGICSKMDAVIHTASMDERRISENPKETLLVNAYGTRMLYLDALACNVKQFIYLSTFHVYGTVEQLVTEESQTNPISDYAVTHLFAEQYLRQLHSAQKMQTKILRLANGIGLPGRDVDKWYLAVNDFCRTIVREKRIRLKSSGFPRRDFIAISDICRAVDVLLKADVNFEVYNVSSEQSISIRETAFMVGDIYYKLTGEKAELEIPMSGRGETGHIKDFTISSHKLHMLGWEPKETMESTIEKILKYELEKRNYI